MDATTRADRTCRRVGQRHTAAAVIAALVISACGGSDSNGTGPTPTASVIVLVSGDQQRARITRALTDPVVVVARTAAGVPVPGVTVSFSAGAGTVDPSSVTTDAAGRAAARWTLGASPGTQTLSARLASGAGASVAFTATADPAIEVVVTALDGNRQQAIVSSAVLIPPTVRVTDRAGTPVSGVRLRFTPTGGSVVAVSEPITDADGRATVGSWTMGSTPAAAAVSVAFADGDVATTAPMPTFAATAVAVGDVATSPARDYVLQSSAPLILSDSVAQLRMVFPSGAHGTLTVARIVGGPAAPFTGATRASIAFDGPETLALELTPTSTGEPAAYLLGVHPVTMEGPAGPHWIALPQTPVGDVVQFVPEQAVSAVRSPALARASYKLSNAAHVALGLLPISAADRITFSGLKSEARRAINYWINTVPNEALRDNMRTRYTETPPAFSYGADCPSAYERFLPSPHIHFCREAASHTPSHEAGHFLTDLMLAGPRWTAIANLAPGMLFPGVEHAFGKAIGFRETITEDYAFMSSFLLYGHLPSFTTTYDPTAKASGSGIRDLLLYTNPPSSADGPSREGFGTVLLANLMREGADTLVKDFDDEIRPSPALGFTPSQLVGILSHGPRNVMELRDDIVAALNGDEATLSAVAEPMGWSYNGRGFVKNSVGAAVAGARVVPLIKVGGREYRLPESAVTGTDGAFTLNRLFPGAQTLRIFTPGTGGATDSVDLTLTIPWNRATNIEYAVGNLTPPAYGAFRSVTMTVEGFVTQNSLNPAEAWACYTIYGASTSPSGVPVASLQWNNNDFSASGSAPVNTTDWRATHTVSLRGSVRPGLGDTLWVNIEGSYQLRIEDRRWDAGAQAYTWQLGTDRRFVATLRDVPVRPSGSQLTGTLSRAAAITAISSASLYQFDKDWSHSEYSAQCQSTGIDPTKAYVAVYFGR